MTRALLAITIALGLAGCSDIDLFGNPWNESTDSAAAPAPEAGASVAAAAPEPAATEPPAVSAARALPPSPATKTRCTKLARQRASDAAFQGEDPETQEAVYNTTFRDCVAWDAAHRS